MKVVTAITPPIVPVGLVAGKGMCPLNGFWYETGIWYLILWDIFYTSVLYINRSSMPRTSVVYTLFFAYCNNHTQLFKEVLAPSLAMNLLPFLLACDIILILFKSILCKQGHCMRIKNCSSKAYSKVS